MTLVKLVFGSWAEPLGCHPEPISARCQLTVTKVLFDELLLSLIYSYLYCRRSEWNIKYWVSKGMKCLWWNFRHSERLEEIYFEAIGD